MYQYSLVHISSQGNRLLFIGSTSCIIVGLSLASTCGCEHQHLYLLAENKMPQFRDGALVAYIDHHGP
jgi:hypothetical protein